MHGFNALVGLAIVGLRDGQFIVELNTDHRHMHDLGRVHGGVYLTLLDTAMARATREQIEADEYVQTVDLRTSFLRACESERITAKASIVRYGRRVVFAEARLTDARETLLATASATMIRQSRLR